MTRSVAAQPSLGGAAAPTPGLVLPGRVKRVALVVSQLRLGGAERVVVHLASALRGLGVAAEILCLQEPGVLADDAQAAGVPVVALRSLRGYDLAAVRQLAKELRRLRPDVINVHDRCSLPYVVLANLIGGRRPVVFSAHGLLLQDQRARLRDRLPARGVAAVTAVSDVAAREYGRLLGWKGQVEVIANGVPPLAPSAQLRRQLRQSLQLSDDTFVFLAAGNIKPEKGFEDLLAAAARLGDLAGGRSFVVLIAGGVADPQYHASLLALQGELGLEGTVRFLGLRSDIHALYSAADAFTLTSRKEGLPMVLLEAMSAGLPVAATEVGGVPKVVRDQVDGLLVPPASPARLAEGMRQLLHDEALRVRLGAAAQARIDSHYGVRRMAEKYLQIYAGVDRPSVLMLGPLPPLTGGMATVARNLRDSDLGCLCRLETLNSGKATPQGRPLIAGVWAQIRLLGRVLGTVLRRRVGLVHIHTCALFSFWRDIVHMIAVRLLGCRVVWHLHDGSFLGFISQGSRIKRALIRWALRRGAAVIVLSEEARDRLRPFAPGVCWRVVPNGVPLGPTPQAGARASCPHHAAETAALPEWSADRRLAELPEKASNGSIKLLFLGNLTHRKGAYDLIAAVEAAARREVRPLLWLAGGEVAAGQRDAIEQRIAASPCRGQLCLLGLIDGAEKQRAISQADCIVLPSYAEGLPMALLEGMAAGMPAIATRIGSVGALVDDGVEGFLIEPGDVAALADRICRLAGDAGLRRRMGQAACRRVQEQFSLKIMAERVYRIYLEALSESRNKTTG